MSRGTFKCQKKAILKSVIMHTTYTIKQVANEFKTGIKDSWSSSKLHSVQSTKCNRTENDKLH